MSNQIKWTTCPRCQRFSFRQEGPGKPWYCMGYLCTFTQDADKTTTSVNDSALPKPKVVVSGSCLIEGVGKETPTAINAAGGKQSASPFRADLLPPLALLEVAKVLKHGADKYGANNWHKIAVSDHINHAYTHLLAFLSGDGQDDHLEHCACRILFALDSIKAGRVVK